MKKTKKNRGPCVSFNTTRKLKNIKNKKTLVLWFYKYLWGSIFVDLLK